MRALLHDIRYAVRTLTTDWMVTSLAVLCLALGIGANTAMFSGFDAIMLKPFPFTEPDRLVVLAEYRPAAGINRTGVSYADFTDWRHQSSAFAAMAAQGTRSLTLSDRDEPFRLMGATVSWDLFPMLGIHPQLGRQFRPEEDQPGAAGTVLMSDDVWRTRYLADPFIVGRALPVNGKPHVVVGIMPPRFRFPTTAQAWVPIQPIEHASPRTRRDLRVYARLKPQVTLMRARQELAVIARRLEQRYPGQNDGWRIIALPFSEALIPHDMQLVVITMMGAVSLVLLIACTNVANLLLARATSRSREFAIRAALGAGRLRIVRQLVTESVLIALLSAPCGLALAYWGLDLLDKSIPEDAIPYYIRWDINSSALFYTLGISLFTGLLFGLAPAIHATKGDLEGALKESPRGLAPGLRRNGLRSALVIGEIALSLILLVGASLFVRSFLNLQQVNPGFETNRLLTLRVYMAGAAYDPPYHLGAMSRRVDDIIRRVEAVPGVRAVAASNLIPLGSGGSQAGIAVDGGAVTPGEPGVLCAGVTAHFFRALGISLKSGRDFDPLEAASGAAVAIINETMAKRVWSTRDPVGQRFRLVEDTSQEWLTVIGVVPDFELDEIKDPDPIAAAFAPYPRMPVRSTGVLIRTAGADPATVTHAVRDAIRASDPGLALFDVQMMETLRQKNYWQHGVFSWLFSVFSTVALLLTAVGVYGVLSYTVSQRAHEIGVRMALGARRGNVMWLIVGEAFRLVTAGVAAGLAGAFAATHLIQTVLYKVSATDAASFAGVAVFLVAVATAASYEPARRAASVDPIVVLRER